MIIITGLLYDLLLIKIYININLPLQMIKPRHVAIPFISKAQFGNYHLALSAPCTGLWFLL